VVELLGQIYSSQLRVVGFKEGLAFGSCSGQVLGAYGVVFVAAWTLCLW
jgi:hypothetical protein